MKKGKVHVDVATMESQDPAFKSAKASLASKSEFEMPAGSQLVLLVDNACMDAAKQSVLQSASRMAMSAPVRASQLKELKIQAYSIQLEKGLSVSELAELADADECVVSVSNNVKFEAQSVPNDPGFSSQKYMATINAAQAFDVFYSPSNGIKKETIVAVVDSGVDGNHVELKNRMWKNAQGHTGIDFINQDYDPMDDFGHGTFVAGIIGSEADNKIGVAGVAGKSSKIMAIKILDDKGAGDAALTINGINFAVQNGAKVINISTSAPGSSPALQKAIQDAIKAGVVIVTAAGNEGVLVSSAQPKMPAIYGPIFSGMITVGSIDSETLRLSSFSNFGLESVEIGAPGENGIVSIYPNDQQTDDMGTSFSSPQVAGAAALVIGLLESRGYQATPDLVEKLITESGTQNNFLSGMFINAKHLNLAALGQLINQRYPATTSTPVPATPTPAPSSNAGISLVVRQSGKCLDIAGASTANAAGAIQWDCKGSINQKFELVPAGSGLYSIKAKHSGKCLDIAGASTASGAKVIQFDCHSGLNQKFALANMGSGNYMIISAKSGKCLDVAGAPVSNNAPVLQWDCHGQANQQFQLK